jgi:hypothetical protein
MSACNVNIEKSSRILRQCVIINKDTGEHVNLRPVDSEHFCRIQGMNQVYLRGGRYTGKFGGDILTMPHEDFCDLMNEIIDESEKVRRTSEWWQDNVFGPMEE